MAVRKFSHERLIMERADMVKTALMLDRGADALRERRKETPSVSHKRGTKDPARSKTHCMYGNNSRVNQEILRRQNR